MHNNNHGFNDSVRRINKRLGECLSEYPHKIQDLSRVAKYAVLSSGHRWRPVLFLKIYKTLSRQKNIQSILPIACSMEFLHTASIILDDLPSMDNALLRRGKKTSHLVFGEAKTILTAVWLCDVAQHLIHSVESKNRDAVQFNLEDCLRLTKSRLMTGQIMDLQQKQQTVSKIIKLYQLKSGIFYAFAASAPARLLGMRDLIEPLERFGNYLGIAYQLSDDIADQVGNKKQLGKDIRKDDGKFTIPQKFGINRAIKLRDFYREKAVAHLQKLPYPTNELINLADRIIHG